MDRGTERVDTSAVTLPAETASTPRARVFVRAVLAGILPADLVATAELCVSELVTNAVLHAGTSVRVQVVPVADGIRIEVGDGSGTMPLRVRHSLTASTGRGLGLVTALTRTWGVELHDGGGKTVWCELATTPDTPTDEEALLAAWDDDVDWDELDVRRVEAADQVGHAASVRDQRVPGCVVFLGYPVVLSMRLREHYDALVRECQLLWAAARRSGARPEVPHRLAELAEEFTRRYREDRAEPERRRLEAFARGEVTIDLVYPLRPELKQQLGLARAVLGEMDEYSRRNALLTLATPPDIHALMSWLLEEYLRQADGEAPRRWDGPLR